MIDTRVAVLILAGLTALAPARASADTFELRSSLDFFTRDQSAITAFHSLSLLRELWPGTYLGGSLVSAAGGDGGGLFIGGFEAMHQVRLGEETALEFGAFVGGGGGATVVLGDGLMTRASVHLRHRISDRFSVLLGLSYIDITGSPISTPAISVGFSGPLDLALTGGHRAGVQPVGGTEITALKPLVMAYFPQGSLGRSGSPLTDMGLVGAELTFSGGRERRETFMRAVGAMAGDGAGYAEWTYGWRWRSGAGPLGLRGFAELGAGFAGGGDVDTGGGLVASAGAGVSLPLFGALEAELGGGAIAALGGDFTAWSAFARAAMRFGANSDDGMPARRWQLSSGLSGQLDHPGLRNPGVPLSGSPVLAAFSLDLFLTDRLYFLGDAQTVMTGQAGGYALGAMGIGYELPLGDGTWSLAGEVFAGAAAGGGIATGSGLIGGARVELDYALNERVKLSAGVGKIVSAGSAAPVTVSFGLKMPFTTFH